MTFEEAIVTAVRKYYAGKDPEALMEASEGEFKYTREYFDELEEEIMSSSEDKKSKKDEEVDEYESD
jgi:ABC-type transporter lipoprotein component MlaA